MTLSLLLRGRYPFLLQWVCQRLRLTFDPKNTQCVSVKAIRQGKVFMAPLASNAVHPTCAVNLRVRDDVRALIDRAAKTHGKSRSEFMIDAARRAAG